MSAVAVRAVVVPLIDELAATANREHDLSVKAGLEAIEHAILVGEALLAARKLVATGEWYRWLDNNTTFSRALATVYQRVAHYKHLVGSAPSLNAAQRMLRGEPDIAPKGQPKATARPWAQDAHKLREAGSTQDQIAEILGVSQSSVSQELNPKVRAKVMERNRRREQKRRAANKVFNRAKRDSAAKRAGGGISELYSRIRLAAESAGALGDTGETPEIRLAATLAHRAIVRAEDEIAKVLGL